MTTRATGATSRTTTRAVRARRSRARPLGAVSPQRRALDVVVALVALVLLLPVLAVAALAVRVSSPGPVVFRQQRLTRGHRPFTMYKLRTMRVGAAGPEVTRSGDPRVTGPGRFLRSTSLDELPQLLNVLRGDMTLVGPRPETPALAERYPAELQWVLDETPGLTGPSQITLRDDVSVVPDGAVDGSGQALDPTDPHDVERWYVERLVPRRVATDRTYLLHPTVPATLRVMAQTVRYLVTGRRPEIPLDA